MTGERKPFPSPLELLSFIESIAEGAERANERATRTSIAVAERVNSLLAGLDIRNHFDAVDGKLPRRVLRVVGVVEGLDGACESSFEVVSENVLLSTMEEGGPVDKQEVREQDTKSLLDAVDALRAAVQKRLDKEEAEKVRAERDIAEVLAEAAHNVNISKMDYADVKEAVEALVCVVEAIEEDDAGGRTITVRHGESMRRFEAHYSRCGNLIAARELVEA